MLVVDAENVRRSIWPNVGRAELVELCGAYAEREGVGVEVVFDGPPPDVQVPVGVTLTGERGLSADDLVAARAATLAPGDAVATSDRGLRDRLPAGVRLVGGGRLVRILLGRER